MSLIQIETVTPLVNNATDIEPTSIVVPALGRIETPNPAATYSEIEADMSMLVSSGKLPNATLDGIIETSVTESTAAAAEKFEFNDGELDLTEIFAVTPINSDSAIIDINTEHLNLTETDKNDTIIVPGQLTSAIRSYATLEDFCDKLILALITMVEVNNLDVIEFDSADSTTLPSKLFTVGNNAVDIELNGIVDKLDIQTLDGGNINADVSEKLLGIDTLHTNLVQCENQAGINNDSTVEITMWPQWYIFENGILTILQAFDYSQTGSRLDID